MEEHFKNAVEYIKNNLEDYEIQHGWANICKHYPLPNEVESKIIDILDDYTNDNDLPEDWWYDYDIEDFFLEIDS